MSSRHRRATRTSRRSPPASRATSTTGARSSRRSRGTRLHLKFYYQMQAEVGQQITRVLDALRETEAYENTIVIFCLRSRRHAGRPRRDAREVARRLRGSDPRAVHRLQPAAARRRPRARHPDQPRRPDPDAARPHRHRPRPGARPRAVRPQRRPPARRARPLGGDPRRRAGRARGADPVHHRR